jgi:6-phosphogluconolactonase
MAQPSQEPIFVFTGAYTGFPPHPRGRADGVDVFRMQPETGSLTHVSTQPGVDNPTYLAVSSDHRQLYAINAVNEIDGVPGGAVEAFSIDQQTGALTFLDRVSTVGPGPAFVAVDSARRFVLVANYHGGSIALFPVLEDGRLAPASDFIQHVGSSVHPSRQAEPHAHSINLDPTERFALVADLGLDRIVVYRLDRENRKLVLNDPPFAALEPGAGPRHLDFHPNGQFVFVINELASTVTGFIWDGRRGALTALQTLSTLPPGWVGENSTADIHVHPSGKFVYGSNRGHDSLAVYTVDETSGQLTYVENTSTRGKTPRNFAIDPTGRFILVANQDTDSIVTFRVDQSTGKLAPNGDVVSTGTPVCVKITPMGGTADRR